MSLPSKGALFDFSKAIQSNNWVELYKDSSLSRKNPEDSDKILEDSCKILLFSWPTNFPQGMNRKNGFFFDTPHYLRHKGNIPKNSASSNPNHIKFSEKLMVRAMFNGNPLIGHNLKVLDYEIPVVDYNHVGEIDMILEDISNSNLLLVEAKRPDSTESALRAILEIYVYAMCLNISGNRKRFIDEANTIFFPKTPKIEFLVPSILVFEGTHACRQLDSQGINESFLDCLNIISKNLKKNGFGEKIEILVASNKLSPEIIIEKDLLPRFKPNQQIQIINRYHLP